MGGVPAPQAAKSMPLSQGSHAAAAADAPPAGDDWRAPGEVDFLGLLMIALAATGSPPALQLRFRSRVLVGLLRALGHRRFREQEHARDRYRVFQRGAYDLDRIDDAGLEKVHELLA